MAVPVALPYNPGGLEIDGAIGGINAILQTIGTFQQTAAPNYGNISPSTSTSASAFTLTPQNILGGVFTHTSGSGGVAVTLPTAALLAASWPGLQVGATAQLLYVNINSNTSTDTLTTASGWSLQSGSASSPQTVAANTARFFSIACTAAPVNIVALSWSNGIATVTTNLPHGFAAGNSITVSNLQNAAFNAAFTVATVIDAYHFTFAISAATIATAWGSPSVVNTIIPNPSPLMPGIVNLTTNGTAFTLYSWFAWPATLIV